MSVPVTMRQIAEQADVSIGTVSHVINGTAKVREKLRVRVVEAIRSLGYQPSQLARGLRRNQTNMLGIIMPYVTTEAMLEFLDRFAKTIRDDEHVAMVLDQAGWHGANALRVPDNITLLPLPPYSPELNPVERVWLFLKERFLSHRLHANYDAVADAASKAWNRLCAEVGRLTSLCSYSWIPKVKR